MSFSQNFILQSKLLAQYRRPVNTRLCGIVVPSSTQTPFRKYSYLPKRTAGFSRLSAPPRLNPGLGLDPSLRSPGHTRSFSSTGQKHDKYTHSVTRIGPLSKKKKYEGLPCPIPQRPKGWPTSILSFNDYRYYKPILRSTEWDFAKVPSTVDGKRTESLVKFYAMDSDEDRLKFQTILKDLQEVEKHHVDCRDAQVEVVGKVTNVTITKYTFAVVVHTHSACIDESSLDGMSSIHKWLARLFNGLKEKDDRIPISGITIRDVRFALLLDDFVGQHIDLKNFVTERDA